MKQRTLKWHLLLVLRVPGLHDSAKWLGIPTA